jgi:hypothetical protein
MSKNMWYLTSTCPLPVAMSEAITPYNYQIDLASADVTALGDAPRVEGFGICGLGNVPEMDIQR